MNRSEHCASPPFPPTVTVEPILGCNLRCPACYVGNGLMQRSKTRMSLDQFRHVASEIAPFAKRIYLHSWGEPMLHPNIIEMIRIASRFAHVNISTNGQNMTADLAWQMIEAGVFDVIVSIDGVDQETYEKYRVGGDLTKALNALSFLVEAKKALGTNTQLIFQALINKFNEPDLEELRNMCRRMGDVVFYEKTLFGLAQGVGDHLLPRSKKHRRFECSTRVLPTRCQVPWTEATIYSDGTVVPCCYFYNGQPSFGNVFEHPFKDIWLGEAVQQFRRDLAAGNTVELCSRVCGSFEAPKPSAIQKAKALTKTILKRILPRVVTGRNRK